MLTLGTGNGPEMHQGLPVTTEPFIQFQTSRCTSTSIMGPAELVTSTVTSVGNPGNNFLATTPHVTSIMKQHTDKVDI